MTATTATDTSAAVAGEGLVDHARCEAPDCDAVICCCRGRVCAGAVAQACVHHSLLCHACAPVECRDCADLWSAEGLWAVHLLPQLDVEPVAEDTPPTAREDLVTCVDCDHGGVPTGDPAFPVDSCTTCDGTGYVPLAAWLAGHHPGRTAA